MYRKLHRWCDEEALVEPDFDEPQETERDTFDVEALEPVPRRMPRSEEEAEERDRRSAA